MGRYHHLSIEEREDIMCMRREHKSLADIAAAIGRDKSTVSRELSRNGRGCGAGGARESAPFSLTGPIPPAGGRARARARTAPGSASPARSVS